MQPPMTSSAKVATRKADGSTFARSKVAARHTAYDWAGPSSHSPKAATITRWSASASAIAKGRMAYPSGNVRPAIGVSGPRPRIQAVWCRT